MPCLTNLAIGGGTHFLPEIRAHTRKAVINAHPTLVSLSQRGASLRITVGISGGESFSGEGFHHFYIVRLLFLGTEYSVRGVLENMDMMVCIDLYLGGIWFCQLIFGVSCL